MSFVDINRKQILEGFIEVFTRISNEEYQKRIWVRGKGPECDDFTEIVCQFFDIGEPVLDNYKNFNISDSQYDLLIKFRDEFETFRVGPGRNYLPEQFLESPEWKKIIELAKEVLEAFHYQKLPKS